MRYYYEEDFEKNIDWDEEWDNEEWNNEEWSEELYGDENWIVEYDLEQQRQRQRQKQRRKPSKPTTQTQIGQQAINQSGNQNVGSTEDKPEQSVISTQNTQPEKTTSQKTPPQGFLMNINVNRIPTQWIVIGLIGIIGIILLVFWMRRR